VIETRQAAARRFFLAPAGRTMDAGV